MYFCFLVLPIFVHGQQWNILKGINDVYGVHPDKVHVIDGGKTNSYEECQAKADNVSQKIFTWHDENQGSWANDCWFRKDMVWDPRTQTGHTTGYKGTLPSPTPPPTPVPPPTPALPTPLVWPIPQMISTSGIPLKLSKNFQFKLKTKSSIVSRAIARYEGYIHAKQRVDGPLESCEVVANSTSGVLDVSTSYAYSITVSHGVCTIVGETIYGAMYGLETFTQLAANGTLRNATIHVNDAPAYPHRGVMIDHGRRFFPVDVVENILDTMSFNKMNVLHLHASDMCRFGVESKKYPELKINISKGILEGFYTAADVSHLISYARDRGIRVMPEFDMPGHAASLTPLRARGVEFCLAPPSPTANWCTMRGANGSVAQKVMPELVAEMIDLFNPETFFHLGGDETRCNGAYDFEKLIISGIEKANKTAMAWSEVYANHAASPKTVIQTWKSPNASELAANGTYAVESNPGRFYVSSGSSGPKVTGAWCDLGKGKLPADRHKFLLGGEVAMWTGGYCYINDCVRPHSPIPGGAPMFNRTNDAAFGQSVSNMIWPRGHLAAGSFWNYQPNLDKTVIQEAVLFRHNSMIKSRGGFVCPSGCSCNVVSACGIPYVNKSNTKAFSSSN